MRRITLAALLTLPFFLAMGTASRGAGLNAEAPDFTLEAADGRRVSLSDFRGRVVFIDFWASWCPPCKKEFPEIKRLLDRYAGANVTVLAVNIDKKRSHAEDFLKDVRPVPKDLVVLFDPEAKVVAAYNAMAMPTSYIIDKSGVVRHMHLGFRDSDPEAWAREIDGLLR